MIKAFLLLGFRAACRARHGGYGVWVCLGLFIGFAAVFRKPRSGRKPGWEEPGNLRALDRSLKKRLALRSSKTPGKSRETFMGLARGVWGGRPVFLDWQSRERHMQIVGPTRSGKSQLLFSIAAQDMKSGFPVFFMEAKGDASDFDQFLALAQLARRESGVRYFNPQDPRSMSFNPIRRMPGQDVTSLANQISRILGREPGSSGEAQEYYKSVDYAKIQNMAEVFWDAGLQYTLRDCFCYFNFSECREKAFQLCKNAALVDMSRREFEQNPNATALTSVIRPYTTGPLGEALNTYAPQIKLEEIFSKNQLAYFAIPIGHLPVLANPLGRMLISGLNSIATWRQQQKIKPGPASIILDEFSEFATPAFRSFIQTVGSARFWTILSHQDLGQLRNIQGMDKEAFDSVVFNNASGCKVCFRSPDPEDAEFWAATLGTYQTFEDTERFQRTLLGARGTGEISRRKVEHFKVHPNTLKNLRPGTALVFSPGREDSLVRTARVFELTKDLSPRLAEVAAIEEPGLNLAAAIKSHSGGASAQSLGTLAQNLGAPATNRDKNSRRQTVINEEGIRK